MGGESSDVVRAARRAVLTGLVASLLALAASSCGTSEPSTAQAPNNLLAAAQLKNYPRGSAERTFLEYWSALQFRAWADVAAYYDPAFRDFVGTTVVIGGKKLEASNYSVLKPTIVRLKQAQGATTIFYALRRTDGTKELASITWREEDGNWQIVYDSRLDAELAQLAQNRVELKKTGVLPIDAAQISAEARRAGDAAARIQTRFLQQELEEH